MTKTRGELEVLDEIVKLLAVQVRRLFPSQREAAVALKKVGLPLGRIAELLGTTTATVAKDLQRAKKTG